MCAEILLSEGSAHLVVTHKSILRALLCVAMGLPKVAFRAVDCNNGGVTVFRYAHARFRCTGFQITPPHGPQMLFRGGPDDLPLTFLFVLLASKGKKAEGKMGE